MVSKRSRLRRQVFARQVFARQVSHDTGSNGRIVILELSFANEDSGRETIRSDFRTIFGMDLAHRRQMHRTPRLIIFPT